MKNIAFPMTIDDDVLSRIEMALGTDYKCKGCQHQDLYLDDLYAGANVFYYLHCKHEEVCYDFRYKNKTLS